MGRLMKKRIRDSVADTHIGDHVLSHSSQYDAGSGLGYRVDRVCPNALIVCCALKTGGPCKRRIETPHRSFPVNELHTAIHDLPAIYRLSREVGGRATILG